MNDQTNALPLLVLLSERLDTFRIAPSPLTRDRLFAAMGEYQKASDSGAIAIPRTLPEPLRNARNLGEWWVRLLTEAMAMFRIAPRDDRFEAMRDAAQGYIDAVAMGRIKP